MNYAGFYGITSARKCGLGFIDRSEVYRGHRKYGAVGLTPNFAHPEPLNNRWSWRQHWELLFPKTSANPECVPHIFANEYVSTWADTIRNPFPRKGNRKSAKRAAAFQRGKKSRFCVVEHESRSIRCHQVSKPCNDYTDYRRKLAANCRAA